MVEFEHEIANSSNLDDDRFLKDSTSQIEIKHLSQRQLKRYNKALNQSVVNEIGFVQRKQVSNVGKDKILKIGLSYILILSLLCIANYFVSKQVVLDSVSTSNSSLPYYFDATLSLNTISKITKWCFGLVTILFIPLIFSSFFNGNTKYIKNGFITLAFTFIWWQLLSLLLFNLGSGQSDSMGSWHLYGNTTLSDSFYSSSLIFDESKISQDLYSNSLVNSLILETKNYSPYFYVTDMSMLFEMEHYVVGGFVVSAILSTLFSASLYKQNEHKLVMAHKAKNDDNLIAHSFGITFAATLLVLVLLPLVMVGASSLVYYSYGSPAYVAEASGGPMTYIRNVLNNTSYSGFSMFSYTLINLIFSPFGMTHFATGLGSGGVVVSSIVQTSSGIGFENQLTYSSMALINNGAIPELVISFGLAVIIPVSVMLNLFDYSAKSRKTELQTLVIVTGVFVMLAGSYASIAFLMLLFVIDRRSYFIALGWSLFVYLCAFLVIWYSISQSFYIPYNYDYNLESAAAPLGQYHSHIALPAANLAKGGSYIGLTYSSSIMNPLYYYYDSGLLYMFAQLTPGSWLIDVAYGDPLAARMVGGVMTDPVGEVIKTGYIHGTWWIFVIELTLFALLSCVIFSIDIAKTRVLTNDVGPYRLEQFEKFRSKFNAPKVLAKVNYFKPLDVYSNFSFEHNSIINDLSAPSDSLNYEQDKMELFKQDDFYDDSLFDFKNDFETVRDDVELTIIGGQHVVANAIDVRSDAATIPYYAHLNPVQAQRLLESQFNIVPKKDKESLRANHLVKTNKVANHNNYEFDQISILDQLAQNDKAIENAPKIIEPIVHVNEPIAEPKHEELIETGLMNVEQILAKENQAIISGSVPKYDPSLAQIKREYGNDTTRPAIARSLVFAEAMIRYTELVHNKAKYLLQRLNPLNAANFTTLDRAHRDEKAKVADLKSKIDVNKFSTISAEFENDIKVVELIQRQFDGIAETMIKSSSDSADKDYIFKSTKNIENDALFLRNIIIKYVERLSKTKTPKTSNVIESRETTAKNSYELVKGIYESFDQMVVFQDNQHRHVSKEGHSTPNKRNVINITPATLQRITLVNDAITKRFSTKYVVDEAFKLQNAEIRYIKSQIDHIRDANAINRENFNTFQTLEAERQEEEFTRLRDELAKVFAKAIVSDTGLVNQHVLDTIQDQVSILREQQVSRLGIKISIPNEDVIIAQKQATMQIDINYHNNKAKASLVVNNILIGIGTKRNVEKINSNETDIYISLIDERKIDKKLIGELKEFNGTLIGNVIHLVAGELTEFLMAEFGKLISLKLIKRA